FVLTGYHNNISYFFFSSRRRHTRFSRDWSSDVCSSDLIDTYRKHIPTWHRYWAVRRRALGVETLHPYDIWAPITSAKPHISFEQAVDWISEGMAPLGDEYVNVLRRGCLEPRRVDRALNQGKTQGAFS